MLINLRDALNAPMAEKRLSYDAEVEYLSSLEPGSYIDLGLNSTTDKFYNFEISFALNASSAVIPFGYVYGATARYGLWSDSGNWYVGANSSNSIDLGAKDTDWHHVLTNFGTSVEVDGSTLAIGGGSVRSNIGLNLFASVTSSSGATSRSLSRAKISMFRIWDTDGNLLRDMIPVRVGTTGYLYDRVSGTLFGNQGTGDFVLGPDVVPVEYIESYGAEWIATGVNAAATSSSLRTVASLRFTTLSSGEHDIMGSGNVATPTMGRNGSRYFMWAKTGTSWFPADCDTNWHTMSYTFNNPSGRVFELDGTSYTGTQGNTFKTGNGVYIFASSPNRYALECQMSKLAIWQDGNLIRNYTPVRVGTDATSWEGAMMDVLPRRIYRNAGTGAFTYGNDLKISHSI